MMMMMRLFMVILLVASSIPVNSGASDTISTTQFMKDGETVMSANGSFEMGFFSPGNSKNRYVGIWYSKLVTVRTVVWVANREAPLNNTSGLLKVVNPGILVLVDGSNTTIWSTNTSRNAQSPVAQLLDSGNLVVKDAKENNPENFLWQGFDYPSDTLLPGMKLGKNLVTGLETFISGWKSSDDPAPGEYSAHCVTTGYPQTTLQRGSVLIARSGPWNGIRFTGSPNMVPNTIYTYELVFNKKEVYYSYHLLNSSVISRFVLEPNGIAQRWTWVSRTHDWVVYLAAPIDGCDTYSLCGAHGVCNIETAPLCACLDRFVPKNRNEWASTDWSHGCVRRTPLDCKNDGFLKYEQLKLPDTRGSWFNTSMTLKECEMVCLQNCSCTAYSNLDIRGAGSGCLLWFGDLIDMRHFSQGGQDIYIRMASSELESVTALQSGSKSKKNVATIKVILPIISGLILLSLSLTLYIRTRRKNLGRTREGILQSYSEEGHVNDNHREDLELPLIHMSTIVKATKSFSSDNKLGEGGFGPVYKGVMEDGQEIAVKRLSKTSSQGIDEFKNEVICISKLQHRNLVKLRGCCIKGDEKMLIYEFMPNKSLDLFIFDEHKSTLLDWSMRFHIIKGIARGLLYLHQDSRLRIIHRDLKTSNILLDYEMNPKISDFGLARSFVGDETGANTNRVVGTYGYMSPEYAADGLFSVKSDVFSFGVIVMEIVSGKKNRGFFHQDHHHNLLGHAWRLYREGRPLELIDAPLGEPSYESEAIRCIQVGLLCAQQHAEDRPSMCSVVTMLDSEGALPQPKPPGFFAVKNAPEAECSSSTTYSATFSVNDVTITRVDAR